MYSGKIAVIVPIYNVEKYVAECIESIIKQTYHNLEIILVDDGSTDSSGKICDEYGLKDTRIRVIHQENNGVLIARYNGLRTTDCEYVTFVDGDDWIDLDTYEKVSDSLGNVDIVAYGGKMYYNSRNMTKELTFIQKGKYSRENIEKFVMPNMIWNIKESYYGLHPSLCMKIMKRELVWNCLARAKDLNIHFGDDAAVVYPMVKEADSLVVLEECFYYHRQREAGELKPYLSDDELLSKVWKFYSFLKEQFSGERECLKQIDYLYIFMVSLRKHVYGDYVNNDRYIFPFASVERNSNIILYGAGSVGQTYYEQIRRAKYCNLVAWVDKNYLKYQIGGLPNISNIDVISKTDFDYIVISVVSIQAAEQIRNELQEMGIDSKKIIRD